MATNGDEYGLFFNSNNGDRKYDASSFEYWLKKFFTQGVFTGDLQVAQSSGMTVNVGTGYANVDGKVRFWNSITQLTLDPANSIYPRIDTIVITRDNTNRQIILEVVTGQYSGNNPQPTAPIRNAEKYQLILAQIYVGNSVTEITQADITDTRLDPDLCGIVTGTVTEMDFSQFAAQFEDYYQQFVNGHEADFEAWMAEQQDDFDTWFANLHYVLDGDVAGHLQNEIDELAGTTLTATLAAGATTLTFTDSSIGDDSFCDIYTDPYGVVPINAVQSGTTVTLTFDPQENAVTVKLIIRN